MNADSVKLAKILVIRPDIQPISIPEEKGNLNFLLGMVLLSTMMIGAIVFFII